MASLLDVFTIGFNSEDLKKFNEELKATKKNLDQAEEEFKDIKKVHDELEEEGEKDSEAFKKAGEEMEKAGQKVDEFRQKVDELENKSEFKLGKLRQSFQKTVKAMAAMAVISASVRKALSVYETAEQIGNLAQKADIAVESLQRLGKAAERYGGNTESSASTVQSIKSKETKEKALSMGINLSGDPEQTLENIDRKMESLKTDAEKLQLADSLGIDEGTARILIQGVARYREELQRTSKYRLYTKEDIDRMRDYRQVQNDIQQGVKSINDAVASMLLPIITKVAKAIRAVTDWLAQHEGATKMIATFVAIVAGIGLIIGAVMALIAVLQLLWANPVGLAILAVAASITFLVTVINDFITFLQGGDSIIGDILNKLGYDTDAIRADIIKGIEQIKAFITSLIERVKNMAAAVKKTLVDLWNNIPEPIKKLLGLAGKALLLASPIGAPIALAGKALEKYKKTPANAIPDGSIQNYNTAVANNDNRAANTKNMTNNSSKSVSIGTVNVQTQATDGAGVVTAIQDVAQFDNGQRA